MYPTMLYLAGDLKGPYRTVLSADERAEAERDGYRDPGATELPDDPPKRRGRPPKEPEA